MSDPPAHFETAVTKTLKELGVSFELRQHANPALTCESAARERRVRVSQIVKCMVSRTADGQLVALLLPGDKMLKIKKACKYLGMGLDLVPAEVLASELGLIVGAISPVQLTEHARMIMDPSVLDEDVVDISSGDPLAGVELSSSELRSLLNAELVEIISTSS